jgi:hypothetical protein
VTLQQTLTIPKATRHLSEVPAAADIDLPPSYSVEEAIQIAKQRRSDPKRKPLSHYFGCLKNSKAFAGDPMEIQREMRAEWED